jgi:hypothetical protein
MESARVTLAARRDSTIVQDWSIATPRIVLTNPKVASERCNLRFVHLEQRRDDSRTPRIRNRHHCRERL